MVVPIGFGVGDFVAVSTLAWNVYKSCKAAPGSFINISNEVLSLYAVLKEADETDLQALVDKYESLGTQSKRTWDRMKWGTENVTEIRSRLVSNTTFLTAYISTSQTRVEQKLDKFISEIQQGKQAPSVISLQTVDDLDPDDEETWKTIRKDLEDIGISVTAFDANKDFIFEWISNAVATGAFQEKAGSSPPGSVLSLDVKSSTSSLSRWVKESWIKESSKKTVMSDMEPPKASKAKTKATRNHTTMEAEQGSNEIRAAGGTHAPAILTKVPRFAAFLAALSPPGRRLGNALLASDLHKARKILKDPATSRLIDKQTLDDFLDWAIRETSNEACALLIDAGADISNGRRYHPQLVMAATRVSRDIVTFLLDRGADVNYQSAEGPVLAIAVRQGNRDLAAFLLDKGADVNCQSGDGTDYSSALRAAIATVDEAMIIWLFDRGADLNAVQSGGYPTAIHQASARNGVDIVDLLINLGVDFNSPQRHYGTPLMLSIYSGRHSTAELLIKKGANIDEVNVPLKHIDENNFVPGDLFPSHPERLFYSALHIAISVSAPYLVRKLLRNGVGIDLQEAYELAEQHLSMTEPCSLIWDTGFGGEEIAAAEEVFDIIKKAKDQQDKRECSSQLIVILVAFRDQISLFWAGMTVDDTTYWSIGRQATHNIHNTPNPINKPTIQAIQAIQAI
ncbi:hypothetical protein JMJ35_004097 [Cladonia borealis]|uniref:Ankyrin n=1 Tax=Cladonia borealis TaxID=184061 RepID=A0AA39R450_9LECA|nr:hypothetical protein JMJ35_004097 [Cladonia borealis]